MDPVVKVYMDLRKIQELQQTFVQSMQWERFNASQVFVHMIEELGEIGRYILYEERYKVEGAGHTGTEGKIETEFAQVFNLFLQLAAHYGIDLENAWQREYEVNKKRFDKDQWTKLADEDSK